MTPSDESALETYSAIADPKVVRLSQSTERLLFNEWQRGQEQYQVHSTLPRRTKMQLNFVISCRGRLG